MCIALHNPLVKMTLYGVCRDIFGEMFWILINLGQSCNGCGICVQLRRLSIYLNFPPRGILVWSSKVDFVYNFRS